MIVLLCAELKAYHAWLAGGWPVATATASHGIELASLFSSVEAAATSVQSISFCRPVAYCPHPRQPRYELRDRRPVPAGAVPDGAQKAAITRPIHRDQSY
jgi:hypothetical protein